MGRPLRFCLMNTFYPPYNFGVDGIFVHRLANELAKRGHKVDVIHCIDSYRLGAHRDPAGTYEDHPNVTMHGMTSPFSFLSRVATQQTGYPFFTSRCLRKILQKNFNVIHYFNISLFSPKSIQEKCTRMRRSLFLRINLRIPRIFQLCWVFSSI
jgi:hypothetical protein